MPNGGVGLKKILFFVFDDAEKRESQRNHWACGVETFLFSRLGFDGRGNGGAANLFSAVLQSHFVTMLFEVRQAERRWKWWPELLGPARLGRVLSDRSDKSDKSDRSDRSDRSDKSDRLVHGNTRHHSLLGYFGVDYTSPFENKM